MPQYFFHLAFGDRVSRDEEGIELCDRAAAREEALAVIRDLCGHAGDTSRCWASWFLQVADEEGEFLRLPIGLPALGVVGAQPYPTSIPPAVETPSRLNRSPAVSVAGSLAVLILARREATTRLLEKNLELRRALSREWQVTVETRARARLTVSRARLATFPQPEPETLGDVATAARPPHPHLVLLPGGRADRP